MLSYITEPLRKLFSSRDAEPYKRKRSKASMTTEREEGEPASKRFHRNPLANREPSSNHRKTSYLSGTIPFGNCIQDWIARIGQMAAKPIMPINFGHVQDAHDLPDDDNDDECEEQKDEDDDSDVEIIETPPQVNGKENSLSQVLTREPLHSVHNTHFKKPQEEMWHEATEESDGTEDSDIIAVPTTSQNGSSSAHHKKPYLEEDQSEDSSPQSSEPSIFKKYCGRSNHHLKTKTPLEPIRLGEREQYRMLLEQCKIGSQVEPILEKPKHFKIPVTTSMRQREILKHGVTVSKLSPFSRQGLVDRLSSDSDWKQRVSYKGNGVSTAKDPFIGNKYLSLKPEHSPSASIMNKLHPKQIDSELNLRIGNGTQLKSHPNHRESLPSVSAPKGEAVRPKDFHLERRNSLPSFDKPKFSQGWLNDLQISLDDCCKYRAEKEEKLERITREMREKREAKIFADNRKSLHRLVKSLRLKSTDASEEEEDQSHFPELTPEMERKVDEVLRPTPPEEVLCEGFRLSIARRDMETLSGLNWLNDEIINFYMNLLMERGKNDNFPSVYAFNTFFYPKLISGGHAALRRWTRQVDIFSYHYVLIPVHLGMHWCLAVIDFKQKKIQYYDSMGGQNNECVNALKTYLHDERKDKKKEEYDMSDWKFETVKNIPQQMNGSDCGMFTLKYAEYITRNAKITFSQRHMPYFRRRMVYEIVTKNLL